MRFKCFKMYKFLFVRLTAYITVGNDQVRISNLMPKSEG